MQLSEPQSRRGLREGSAAAASYTEPSSSYALPSQLASTSPASAVVGVDAPQTEVQRQCHFEAAKMVKKNNLSTAHVNSHSAQVTLARHDAPRTTNHDVALLNLSQSHSILFCDLQARDMIRNKHCLELIRKLTSLLLQIRVSVSCSCLPLVPPCMPVDCDMFVRWLFRCRRLLRTIHSRSSSSLFKIRCLKLRRASTPQTTG